MSYRPSVLRAATIDSVRAAVKAANVGTPVLTFDSPKIVSVLSPALLSGLDERTQANSRRRRWAMAVRTSWSVFGLPVGSQWIACYMCGDVIHAWTADGEHVDPIAGSHPWNLIGACHSCNRIKGDTWTVHNSIRDRIYSAGNGLGYVAGGRGLKSMFGAHDRRPNGQSMGAWVYGTPRPVGLVPSSWAAR